MLTVIMTVFKSTMIVQDGWNDEDCGHKRSFVCSKRLVCPAAGADTGNDTVASTASEPESEFMTIGRYIFIGMICFVVALTIGGLVYMIKTNCRHCQVRCCFTCKDIEKVDTNLDYGTYYYHDSDEKRTSVMEVSDQNPEYGF